MQDLIQALNNKDPNIPDSIPPYLLRMCLKNKKLWMNINEVNKRFFYPRIPLDIKWKMILMFLGGRNIDPIYPKNIKQPEVIKKLQKKLHNIYNWSEEEFNKNKQIIKELPFNMMGFTEEETEEIKEYLK